MASKQKNNASPSKKGRTHETITTRASAQKEKKRIPSRKTKDAVSICVQSNKNATTKSTKRTKERGASCVNNGEVLIYGGIVKCGAPEYANWCFESFWKDLEVYGNQECADEESAPPKYKNLTPNEAAHNWEAILSDAAEQLKKHVNYEERLFDLSDDRKEKIEEFMSKMLDNVESAGNELDEMMEEFISGDYEGDRDFYADKIMRKIHYGIFVQICWAMNQTKNYLRELIEDNDWNLGEIGIGDDDETATEILKLLKNDEIGKGKFADTSIVEAKLKMLQCCPFNKEVVSYCYLDDNGKGSINDIVRAARVDIEPLKRELLKKLSMPNDLSTEDGARAYRERMLKTAKELDIDATEELEEIDDALQRLDLEFRTVDGQEFPTRDEASKQRKLSEYEAKLDISDEDAAKESKLKLVNFIKKLGIDGEWKLKRIDEELERFDRAAKTAGGRLFETREEAEKQRQLVDFERQGIITDEASAVKLKADIIAFAERLGIDGSWKLERVDNELKRFDKLARTAFDIEYQSRAEAAEKRNSPEAFFTAIEKAISSSTDNGFYFKDAIPHKKMSGARSYLSGTQDDDVFAVIDTTLFGSAKIGMVISRWGVVWKNDTVKTNRNAYSWKELATLGTPSKPDRGEITFEKGVIFDFTGSNGNADSCRDTLAKFVAFAKEAQCLDSLTTIEDESPINTDDLSELSKLSCDCLFIEGNIPEKKLRNAFVSMKVREPIDSICVLIDSTVFGSAKEGLLVTGVAVYFKNFLEDPVRIPLENISTIVGMKNVITINSNRCSLINISDDNLKSVCGYINALANEKRR